MAEGLGGLLGAYGSDEDEETALEGADVCFDACECRFRGCARQTCCTAPTEPLPALPRAPETQQTGQVTLMGDEDESGGGLDLSHLTSGPAARGAEADTAARAGGGNAQPARPPSAQGGVGGEGMELDAAPEGAAGGAEQPPADGEVIDPDDPMSALPAEMRQAPLGACDPEMQVSSTGQPAVGCCV